MTNNNKSRLIVLNLFFLFILSSCANLSKNKATDKIPTVKANSKSKFITIKWLSENPEKTGLLGYKIYHGQKSGKYESCIRDQQSPIELTSSEILGLKEPNYKIPIDLLSDECFFVVSAFNSSGESASTPEIHFIKKE